MRTITGDLLELADAGEFDVIVHGCNLERAMGGGIARQIAIRYPLAEEADSAEEKDESWMGCYTEAEVGNKLGGSFTIVNAYTQKKPTTRGTNRLVSYDAVDDVFTHIAFDFPGARIGLPLIGAGLARGDWSIIAAIIDSHLDPELTTVVVLEQDAGRVGLQAPSAPLKAPSTIYNLADPAAIPKGTFVEVFGGPTPGGTAGAVADHRLAVGDVPTGLSRKVFGDRSAKRTIG